MKQIVLMACAVMALAGCQNTQALVHPGQLSDADFMNLWGIYWECRTSMDLETKRADVQQLNRGAQRAPDADPFVPLPESFKRLISKPPVRLSVDPGAMAADCTLSAGHAALEAGRDEVAVEMFGSILVTYRETEYAYFVDQARLGLREVSLRAQAAVQKQVPTLSQAIRVREAPPAAAVVSH